MPGPRSKVEEVRVPGPLAPFAAEFKLALLAMGYTPLSAVVQLRFMVHLSRWLEQRRLTAAELSEARVDEYLTERKAKGYKERNTRRGAAPLLGFLAESRALPVAEPQGPGSPVQVLLARFERYLVTERGLAPATVMAYVARAGRFVAENACDGDVAGLTAGHVTGAVLVECETKSVGAGQYFVAALRSFLRFCLVEGLIQDDLSAAALTVTGRRSSMPSKAVGASDWLGELVHLGGQRRKGRSHRTHRIVRQLAVAPPPHGSVPPGPVARPSSSRISGLSVAWIGGGICSCHGYQGGIVSTAKLHCMLRSGRVVSFLVPAWMSAELKMRTDPLGATTLDSSGCGAITEPGSVDVTPVFARPDVATQPPMDLSIVVRTPSDRLGMVALSYNSFVNVYDYVLIGQEDTLIVENGLLRNKDGVVRDFSSDLVAGGDGARLRQNREFVAAVCEGRPAETSADSVLPALEALQRAQDAYDRLTERARVTERRDGTAAGFGA